MSGSRAGRDGLAILAFLAIMAILPPASFGQEGSARPSRGDLVLPAPAGGGAKFRFLPEGAWARYDRELRLSAAPGESRSYRLEIETESGERSSFAYRIDKRPPPPPSAEPAGGLFDAPLELSLGCEEGSRAYWAVFGPGSPEPAFLPYDPESRPRLEPPAEGTASYTLVAYAEDAAGNRSLPLRFGYRLASPGLQAAPPAQDRLEAGLRPDPSLAGPLVERGPGSTSLSFALGPGARLLVAVGVEAPPSRLSGYAEIEAKDGVARLDLSCPYGWSGKLRVFYGEAREGGAAYAPSPLEVELSYPVREAPAPTEPLPPSLVADLSGRGAFVTFPSYDGRILVSVEGGEPRPYLGPLPVPSGAERIDLAWMGEDGSGQRSSLRSARLALPRPAPEALLAGVEEGAVVGRAVTLSPLEPAASATLRYELREQPGRERAELPPEPTGSSPLLGGSLSFDCPPGEERSFALRYRAFAGASPDSAAGEGKLLRFTIDRSPPPPPTLAASPPAYSDRTVRLLFPAGEPGSSLLASVEVDGRQAPFAPVAEAVELPGDDSGPVSYRLRAYRVDAAGNRSAEMRAVSLVVDRSSIYAAEDAPDAGEGSPTRPYRSLDAAVEAAIAGGKRSLCLRGSLEAGKPLSIEGATLAIVGGFGPGWAKDPSARARVLLRAGGAAPAIAIRGSKLSLRSLELGFESPGTSALVKAEEGELELSDCVLAAGASGDLLFISAVRSKLLAARSSFQAERAMSCAVFKAEASELALRDSIVSAKAGVRAFVAFDLAGGSLVATGSLIESSADLALRLLSLRGSRLTVDRCLLKADSGSGFLRLGSFQDVTGELRNSRVLVSWKGEGLLFESSGSSPAFRHMTISAETSRGRLGAFSASGAAPELWNSIVSFSQGGGTLLRCEAKPGPGILVSDCLWGFETLVDGAWRASTIKELDSLNAANPAFASRAHVSEPPFATFSAPVKSVHPLSRSSACVDAAYPLEGEAYALDFKGAPRPQARGKGRPDIGADEAGE
ncbi:MAG TPA: hypothetical protein PLB91_13745 [Spirochaetales bacterium]|nr:hypothetical protein [Spirochaetales bacterium]HRZ65511.1 hypothetical protein [Spirochaetia bacterium]